MLWQILDILTQLYMINGYQEAVWKCFTPDISITRKLLDKYLGIEITYCRRAFPGKPILWTCSEGQKGTNRPKQLQYFWIWSQGLQDWVGQPHLFALRFHFKQKEAEILVWGLACWKQLL